MCEKSQFHKGKLKTEKTIQKNVIELKIKDVINKENSSLPMLDSSTKRKDSPEKLKEEILYNIINLQKQEISKLYDKIFILEKKLENYSELSKNNESDSPRTNFEKHSDCFKDQKSSMDSAKKPILTALSPKSLYDTSNFSLSSASINENSKFTAEWHSKELILNITGSYFTMKLEKNVEEDENRTYFAYKINGKCSNISSNKDAIIEKIKISGNESLFFNLKILILIKDLACHGDSVLDESDSSNIVIFINKIDDTGDSTPNISIEVNFMYFHFF